MEILGWQLDMGLALKLLEKCTVNQIPRMFKKALQLRQHKLNVAQAWRDAHPKKPKFRIDGNGKLRQTNARKKLQGIKKEHALRLLLEEM